MCYLGGIWKEAGGWEEEELGGGLEDDGRQNKAPGPPVLWAMNRMMNNSRLTG